MKIEMMTIKSAAKHCGVAEIQIWILIRQNKIGYKNIRSTTEVDAQQLSEWMQENANELKILQKKYKAARQK